MGTLQPNRGGVVGLAKYTGRTKWARAYNDFATDAGAIGSINLRGDKLPSGAVILSAYVKVDTLVTTASSGTVALTVESAGDLRAAAVPSGTIVLSTTGTKLTVATRAAAPIVTTAERHVVATIATGAITAGAFSVLVEYIELSSNV